MEITAVNYLAVVAGALAFWIIGALWYSPLLFGKRWQKEIGIPKESISKANMAMVFGLSFVLMLVMVFGMALILTLYTPEEVTWSSGLCLGGRTGLLFAMATMGINYLYQRRSLVLWLIDGIYMIIGLGAAGIILGAWN
jgi:disulfide bond formation protein DsbB